MEKGVSLNKYIAQTGFCSRRAADDLIVEGRVTINGASAKKGNRVMLGDGVEVDGEPLLQVKKSIYIAFNKPKGIETTANPTVQENIIAYIGHEHRIFPVGRLDKNSEGLILLTNDGDFANKLIHSRYQHEKEYIVTVDKPINNEFVKKMSEGVEILGRSTMPCEVEKIAKTGFKIILKQGLNRQIRRMCSALDYKVTSLTRVRVMNVMLGHLGKGKWRNLNKPEITQLKTELNEASKDIKTAPRISRAEKYGAKKGRPYDKKSFGAKRRSEKKETPKEEKPVRKSGAKSKLSYKEFKRKQKDN